MTVHFRPADAAVPPASELIDAMVGELAALYGDRDGHDRTTLAPVDLGPPHGACLVGVDDATGRAVAVGGVRRLGDGVAEIKRMYVVPGARGHGVARALLAALEDAARALGYTRLRLDTGPDQPHAERLYRSSGFAPVADYNGNPYAAFWGEKRL